MAELIRDRYEPKEVVGRGAQGEVLRAIDHQHGRIVALKARTYRPGVSRDVLLAEARMLLDLEPHPNLPLVREDFFEGDRYFLVIDWVEGTDLQRILERRGDPGLPFGTVVEYLGQVAAALDHLHAHRPPVVHRDVKPANLVLTPEGRVVLVDFGIAMRPEGPGDAPTGGTRGYQAPEAARGASAPVSDVFGLAATAFALLTGSPPGDVLPTWEGLPESGVKRVQRALRRGLSIDPDRRPASAGELLERLRSWLEPSFPSGTVTFLMTDIEGSTRLWEQHPEAMRIAVARQEELLIERVERHGGTVVKSRGEGDSLFVVFPRASDAVACAIESQRRIACEPWEGGLDIRVRLGLHTGEADIRDGDYYGGAVNRAGRIRDLALGGQVLLSGATANLTGDSLPPLARVVDLGDRRLRDLARPERLFQLVHPEMLDLPGPGPSAALAPFGEAPVLPLPVVLQGGAIPFVGRRDEIAILRSAWWVVGDGVSRLVLLAGEPGVGKTRLISELARAVHDEGALVLAGRSQEEGIVPYQPFAEVIRWLTARLGSRRIASLLPDGGAELGRLIPELSTGAVQVPSDPQTERYRLFDSISALLGGLARSAPVLLVLDDLHWADNATLLLVRHLIHAPDPAPMLLVATYREGELDRSHALADLLADLRRERVHERVAVRGLDERDVAAFVRAWAAREPPASFIHALHEETHGNPFFIEELLLHLSETGAIDPEAGRWVEERAGLPEGIREVLGRRLSRLSTQCNQLLLLASVAGDDVDLPALEAVSELTEDELLQALDEAVAAHVLVERGPERYAFAQPLIREALYAEIGGARRGRLHRRFGEAIERLYAHDLSRHLGEVARHLLEAAPSGDLARAIDLARRAARQAADQLAYEEAASMYERALAVLDLQENTGTLHCDLLIGLGDVRWRGGHPGRAAEAFDRALNVARERGDEAWEAEALLRLAWVESLASRVERARELLGPARELFERLGDAHGRARVTQALADTWRINDLERQFALLEQAAQLFAEARDWMSEHRVYQDLAYTHTTSGGEAFDRWYQRSLRLTERAADAHSRAALRRTEAYHSYYRGELAAAAEAATEAADLAGRSGNVFIEADARYLGAQVLLARGALDDVAVAGEALVRVATARELPRIEEMGRILIARAGLRQGRPEVCDRELASAERILREMGIDRELGELDHARAHAGIEAGRWDHAIAAAERYGRAAERYGDALFLPVAAALEGRATLGAGRLEEAIARFDLALERAADVQHQEVPLLAGPLREEARALLGDPRRAAEALAAMAPPDDGFHERSAVLEEARGIAAALAGDRERAEAHLRVSAAAWERLGLTVWLARVLSVLGALGDATATARAGEILAALSSPLRVEELSPLA